MARLTRHQLAEHYRTEWLCERDTAETVPCPTCRVPAGSTCVNGYTGRPLDGPPAHPARIGLAASQPSLSPPTQRRPAA